MTENFRNWWGQGSSHVPLPYHHLVFKLVHVQRRHSVILSASYFSKWDPASKTFHLGECPFSKEVENVAKDIYLSVSLNDQYLAMCGYQLMEVGGAREGCLSGIETVFVWESGASFLFVYIHVNLMGHIHNPLLTNIRIIKRTYVRLDDFQR